MLGWRCRIGLILPLDNRIVEPEFVRLAPDGVTVHGARLETVKLDEMPPAAEREAEVLSTMGSDVLVYACNASSFHDGPDAHARIRDRLASAGELPTTTASTAVVRALETLSAARVTVVTPYDEDDNERLVRMLEGNGIDVDAVSGLGLASDEAGDLSLVNEQTSVDTYRRAVRIADPTTDATLIVSTNLASVDVIDVIERDTGMPAVSVNQAMFWHALSLGGVDPITPGYGRLLAPADRAGS